MDDEGKTKQELLQELEAARRELAAVKDQASTREAAQRERNGMEQALRESEQRYKDIVELAPDGIVTANLIGVMTSCNTAFLELTGYARDEIVGKHITRLPTLRVQDIPTYMKIFFSILRGGRLKPFEFNWVHDDGTVRWGEAHASLLKRGARPTGLQAILRDITARKEAAEELESERAFLSAVLDTIEEAIVICDAEGRLIQFNEAARRLHGLADRPIPPDQWAATYDLFQPDGTTPLPTEEIPLYRALRGERVHDAEMVVDPTHSQPKHLVCNGKALTDERGKLLGAVVAMHDITDRKKTMEALRESENKFRSLVDNTPDALFLHDLKAHILDVNQTAVERYGYAREELLGMTTADIDPDYVHREDGGRFWTQLNEDGQIRFEGRHRRKDGTILPVAVSLSAVELQGNERILALAADITERKKAERALRESVERFRDLVEHSFDLICTHDLEGRLLSVNPAAESITGYTAEELVGAYLRDLLEPEVRDQFDDYLAEIESTGEVRGLMRARNRSGEQLILEYHNSLRVEGVPEPIVRGTARDITEQRRAQEALREREDRLSKTMLAANDGMWDWDLTTNEVYFDPRYYAMAGYDVDAFPHRFEAFEKRVHPDDLGHVLEQAERHLKGDIDRFEVEFRFRKKDGSWLWILGRGTIVERGEDGTPLRFIGTHTDITKRKRAEKALARSRNMFETMLHNMPGGMLLIGEDYRIRQVNVRTCDITGYTAEELVGELCDIVCPKGSASNECPIWEGGADQFAGMDTTIKCKDGRKNPILKNTQKITIDGKGYILESFQDIAKRKAMEEELRQQERLATVGQLAAGIAHDFRNILATVILFAQMDLNAPDLPPKLADHLRIIIEESNKATDLVQQILDFSSRAMIRREPLELGSFVAETLDVLRRTIPENVRISLTLEHAHRSGGGLEEDIRPLTVLADPGRLQQALTNLALNARDAMPEGGDLRLVVSRAPLEADETPPVAEMEPGAWVCLTVSDSGEGMTDEVQEHLFEPFFTTKEVGKGTGLGLAQVYGIIRQHGGAIDVETALGEGTTFRIYLPAHDEVQEEGSAKSNVEARRPRARGETLLLVEDSRTLRAATRSILESLGYRVLTADDGREALTTYREEGGVDLVITDLVMPNMGGKALMRELIRRAADDDGHGERSSAQGLRAVGITGYTVENVADELRELGFVELIQKPFDADQLARVIRRALDGEATRRQSQ